ncbi:MAG TPA: DNA polymerase III subunit gamma/tau, partial [Candidatus Saccharimonadales bacterium]|nr:DNA polymerase III subunit gamma/tau [Candidatus Saccharimonadales bacterium]
DLDLVRDNLKKIITSGNIPHAFLFSGPKGTGKTSAARIFAKVVNCQNLSKDGEPCNTCESCVSITKGNNIDVIELDAASNRGIDDIRNLKEGISLAPISVVKKVYIIDEAHMLTLEAANAFLKTLEEPPDHVIFILATTNPEKLPPTVISRLTVVNFYKAGKTEISRQLARVAKGEKIEIEEKAIEKISTLADGSFRDAVKILENLKLKTKKITADDIVGGNFDDFLSILVTRDTKKLLENIEEKVKTGINIKNLIESTLTTVHQSILAKNGIGEDKLEKLSSKDLLDLAEALTTAKKQITSPVPQLSLEIAVVNFCKNQEKTKEEIKEPIKVEEVKTKKKEETKEIKKEVVGEIKKKVLKPGDINFGDDSWYKLLDSVRGKNISIEALLRGARPISFDGKAFELGVYYKFHKERLEDPSTSKILEEIFEKTFGVSSIKINYALIDKPIVVKKETPPEPQLNQNVDKDIIDAAKEIFG